MSRNFEPHGFAALAAQVEHYRLVFRWPERSASLVLPTLCILSVLVHACAFYLFQVVYPPAVLSTPPPAQVTLFTPGTPEGDALLRWVQAQDPATTARPQEVTPEGLGEIRYNPSYATAHTLPKEPTPPAESSGLPSAWCLLDLADAKTAAPESPRQAVATSLAFSERLRSRDAAPNAALKITVKSSASLRPTTFLVGIGDRGDVRYCFLSNPSGGDPSSGDLEIDVQAEALLREHNFSHSETPLEWGVATFTWGAEAQGAPVAPQQPPSQEVPGK